MSDHPIPFSGPMVRALLADSKTQTRRVMKPQPTVNAAGLLVWERPGIVVVQSDADGVALHQRYGVGDRLYVREAWRCNGWATDVATVMYRASEGRGYTAMTAQYPVANKKPLRVTGTWRPGIHMPRWASRLTLTVTDVRVQRLQEISEADAIAEGCSGVLGPNPDFPDEWDPSPVEQYRDLWDRLNAARGFGWSTNPWVVATSFTVARGNIDGRAP